VHSQCVIYHRGLECLFSKTPDAIWDFFEYWARDTWQCDNARETFSHPIPDPYVMHIIPLDESQFGAISYRHPHTPYAPPSCDYCDFFDHDVDSRLLLGRPHRLEALAAFNRKLYLHNLLKTNLSLSSHTSEVRSCEDFDVRSEAPIPLRYDFHDDTYCDDLEEVSDPSSPIAVVPSLEFGPVCNNPEGSRTIHDSSLSLDPFREPKEGDRFEIDARSDD